jgi:hypothetical protein
VPAAPNEREPVESMEVEVRTADVSRAGTDDDVYLRVGPNLRFPLDKRLYDDFERGDRDWYSVPIDDATDHGLRVGDIRQVRIEKSKDGIAGGWKLGGVRLRVNGRTVYTNQHIDRWLEDNHRTWTATNFTPRDPRGSMIPVRLRLGEDDALYGGDDHGDINPFGHRRDVLVSYPLNTVVQRRTRGGNRYGGRLGDGDEAEITYRLETITPELIKVIQPPPPPPPGPKPDLIVTEFYLDHVTVKNQGLGAAGPFRVTMDDTTPPDTCPSPASRPARPRPAPSIPAPMPRLDVVRGRPESGTRPTRRTTLRGPRRHQSPVSRRRNFAQGESEVLSAEAPDLTPGMGTHRPTVLLFAAHGDTPPRFNARAVR